SALPAYRPGRRVWAQGAAAVSVRRGCGVSAPGGDGWEGLVWKEVDRRARCGRSSCRAWIGRGRAAASVAATGFLGAFAPRLPACFTRRAALCAASGASGPCRRALDEPFAPSRARASCGRVPLGHSSCPRDPRAGRRIAAGECRAMSSAEIIRRRWLFAYAGLMVVGLVLGLVGEWTPQGIMVGSVPYSFVLFVLILLGIGMFHEHTLHVATAGATAVTLYTALACPGFEWHPDAPSLAAHLVHEAEH